MEPAMVTCSLRARLGGRGFLHQLITPHGTEVALIGHDLILLQEMSHYGIDTSSCCRHDLMLQENILESLNP